MATILDPAELTCTTDDDDRQAAAFVSHPTTDDTTPDGTIHNWWLYCLDCVEHFTDPDFQVVYLHDPAAGIGRPGRPDHGDSPDQPTPDHHD
jgi:hypothetical protein